mmetsp:Transcript_78254/g.181562  ORF Transcript_78254/g.181562 Transcript_78254/m.181562 type:complete len:120 (-) Transcript_78254:158-517(-)
MTGAETTKSGQVSSKGHRGLFTSASHSSSFSECAVNPMAPRGLHAFLPVTLGRPNFAKEVRAIGKARPGHDVYIYVCGNESLVKSLQDVCKTCNMRSQAAVDELQALPQKYRCLYERFG